jgi:transposase
MLYNNYMLLTYQFKLNPTPEQVVILETWGELLRRHWNYALGERLDWLRRTRSQIDRCSLVSEPIGEIPEKPDYYTQASNTHLHVARQRKEFHYHVSHWLINSYDLIVFETLNIRGLARTRLAKSILDVAWGAFLEIMQAVAVKRGKLTLGVDPRGTSINCSSCGERVEKTLAERKHSCSCGLVIDRDWNSALNLLKRGSAGLPIPVCGGLGDTQPMKQKVSFVNLRCSR